MKIVIPSRYASTRLPGKPLADIAGKPMIVRVWEQAVKAFERPDDVYVAADDTRIMDAVKAMGGNAVMTRADHVSGTDRIAEVADAMQWTDDEIIINVQGDEPLIPPTLIKQVGECLDRHPSAHMATAACPIADMAEVNNPNAVKAVMDKSGKALYFSRAPIPYDRDGTAKLGNNTPYFRHIGIYAYRVKALRTLAGLPPAPMETLESLEQLRALHNSMTIMIECLSKAPPAGVDTPEDLEAVRAIFVH
ncbi:3-deoxy-manno-octulosonate cytidylyltransferase [Kordiimonas sp. SCSIO 12610]|uniref:3-deoxy-manno-octulosonate cytidylyltransferase n=1 Tax=Kordiimonas sp. SCSIO 12610 TaxID=2829597 RepID=UPI00210BD421|nr:3-deoxy-manno-octulosonate cytidylyltransferase [Kordiimonas sp. SCSIO 12610]UTW56233.1 3-deoxy-manno-octulosonate cytidylyltransferase [Kordiimonas sp. SCSIO 12610]